MLWECCEEKRIREFTGFSQLLLTGFLAFSQQWTLEYNLQAVSILLPKLTRFPKGNLEKYIGESGTRPSIFFPKGQVP